MCTAGSKVNHWVEKVIVTPPAESPPTEAFSTEMNCTIAPPAPQNKKILKEIKTKTEIRRTETESSNQKGHFALFVLKTRQWNDVCPILWGAERTQKEDTKLEKYLKIEDESLQRQQEAPDNKKKKIQSLNKTPEISILGKAI